MFRRLLQILRNTIYGLLPVISFAINPVLNEAWTFDHYNH
jgi:hypothetical protein